MHRISETTETGSLIDKPVAIKMSAGGERTQGVSESGTGAKGESEDYARLIWVRIEFVTIGEVDTMNEKFQAEVKIRSKWYDQGDFTEYDKNKNWYPKLYIENALHDVKEEISYSVTRLEDDKCMITETRVAKGFYLCFLYLSLNCSFY